jgi:hypothetical protein
MLNAVMLSVGAPQACPGPMSNIATTISLREIFGLMKNKKKERWNRRCSIEDVEKEIKKGREMEEMDREKRGRDRQTNG